MDDGDGIRKPLNSQMDNESSVPSEDTEEAESSKQHVVSNPILTSNSHSQPLKMYLNFNNINGDCVEKDANQSESSLVQSSSNNSLTSESSDVTRDSMQGDSTRMDADSSSDYSSKSSSFANSAPIMRFTLPKSSDDLPSVRTRSLSELSESSSDSDSSDSDESVDKKIDDDSTSKTLDSHSLRSANEMSEKEDSKSLDCSLLDRSENKCEDSVDDSENSKSPTKECSSEIADLKNPFTFDSIKNSENSSIAKLLVTPKTENTSTSISAEHLNLHHDETPPISVTHVSENLDLRNASRIMSPNHSDIEPETSLCEKSQELETAFCEKSQESEAALREKSQEPEAPLREKSPEPEAALCEKSEEPETSLYEKRQEPETSLCEKSQEPETSLCEKSRHPETGLCEKNQGSEDNIVSKESNLPVINVKNGTSNPDLAGESIAVTVEQPLIKPCSSGCINKLESGSKNCQKVSEKVSKNPRRKTDERSTIINSDLKKLAESFPIQYKGFKTIGMKTKNYKKSFLRWNPFNPARKLDSKSGKYILQKSFKDDVDNSSLQPEYAQYLGLQPIVKFRCSNCGMSTFQSMSALNTHKIECIKNVEPPAQTNEAVPDSDKNSSLVLKRKVFLCTACGTYYKLSELFLHMRDCHKIYMCLFVKCLKSCKSANELAHHLREVHNVEREKCLSLEDIQKNFSPTFFLLCIHCDRVFTEMDDPCSHKCPFKHKRENDQICRLYDSEKLTRLQNTFLSSSFPTDPTPSQCWEIAKMAATLKLNKDITMKPLDEITPLSDQRSFQNISNEIPLNQISSHSDFHGMMPTERLCNTNAFDVSKITSENSLKSAPENLQIKVPKDIEIKPLIPGENNNSDNQISIPQGSAIEIFPIHSEPQKPLKKTRIIRKTIRKKKAGFMAKIRKRLTKADQSLLPHSGIGEDNIVPPISPPIIAPPPIVSDHMEPIQPPSEPMEIAQSEQPDEPETQLEKYPHPEDNHSIPSPPSSIGDRSASPLQTDDPPVMTSLPEAPDGSEIKRTVFHSSKGVLNLLAHSDSESDDSQKLSLVVDENTNNSDYELKKEETPQIGDILPNNEPNNEISDSDALIKNDSHDIQLAGEEVAAMALTLDDKIENVPIQAVVKECVRTSCMSCNYCRHAVKIAVNGKQLALHLLSEHRYTPVKNETNEDVIRKLKSSLDVLQDMYFNTETYDSSDPSIHVSYDKENNFDCFQCAYVSTSHKDLYAHKRKFHTKSLLLCIMCKKNFYSYSELICHICAGTYHAESQVYSVDITFRCCFCRLDTIPSAFRLMVHLRKSHHTCDICLEVCTDQQKLSTHMWKHKLNHLCYRCGIAYASKPDITKHLFWKHGTESVLCKKCLQKKWPHVYHFCIPPTSFICEECNTSFSKAVALKVHKRIHGNDYPYSCPQCEKKYVSKKLLERHVDRHNAVLLKKDSANNSNEDNKDEIINVTDVTDTKELFPNEQSDSNKESDGKDKCHKKHKKEKDKKDKKVLDVYDIPPLNLSSASDSSDDEIESKKVPSKDSSENNGPSDESISESKVDTLFPDKQKDHDMPKLDGIMEGDLGLGDKSSEANSLMSLLKPDFTPKDDSGNNLLDSNSSATEPMPFDNTLNALLPLTKEEFKNDESDSMQNEQVEGIWENFYKTNPQNANLPFPLCAMKSEVAYSIIMGDHDYCQQKVEPVIKEDLPTISNLESNLSDDKLEEVTPLISEKPQTPPPENKESENLSSPKKKLKSPKKKAPKTDDNNSSSSSDSSSDSDSSCSCGPNCSCSSSSESSSSSSSDSDSSTNEDKKQEKRKKKKEKRGVLASKPGGDIDVAKDVPPPEPEVEAPIPVPEDPPIRESELETDESTSDEEFYDRQPQIIANQLLAEKREKQNSLLPAVNNGEASPTIPAPVQPPPPPPVVPPPPIVQEPPPISEPVDIPKPKPTRTKRKRRITTPRTPKIIDKPPPELHFPKYTIEPKTPTFNLYQQTTPSSKHKPTMPVLPSPSLSAEAGGSGSETDNTRLSKRRRVPNKFYGYSSGDEEEKQVPKWRKMETSHSSIHTPKISTPIVPPPTPRIQLTVPKQVIRKPYHKPLPKQKILHQTSSDSSSSGMSDIEDRVPRPSLQPEPVKAEKDVYCYCRCPYDEVSEMIACDDANCKIEWFHFECVGILVPPRGQWFCPGCRKARGLPT